jgi:tRNA A37 threonylcarbamoyladenosine dehydratase
MLLGEQAMNKLANSHVAIFGIGGVGGYVCEALARSGVGHFTLIDHDVVSPTNLNRQIIATMDTIGKYKVDVMKERILSINPNAKVETKNIFYLPETEEQFEFSKYDYVVDAVDTVKAKISLIVKCKETDTPIICSMGAGNKLNPMGFMICDISKTEVDPLAKTIRTELRKRNIKNVKVAYSKEEPLKPLKEIKDETTGKVIPGSNAFVPSAVGLLIASEVIKDLIK